MNVLVTGSNGQLGQEIKSRSGSYPDVNFIFTDINDLDITNYNMVTSFFNKQSIDVLINCAAYTNVDDSEIFKNKCDSVNHNAVETLARVCKNFDVKLIHISTDYVFDGKKNGPYNEFDKKKPINFYGISKSKGEEKIINLKLKNSIIIRTSWLYSRFGNNFVKKIISLAKKKSEINVVNDQEGSPTNALDLADNILKILNKLDFKETKIFHFSNLESCTWYDFAVKICKISKLEVKLNPVSSDFFNLKANRPQFSVLDQSLFQKQFGIQIVKWDISLKNFLDNYYEK